MLPNYHAHAKNDDDDDDDSVDGCCKKSNESSIFEKIKEVLDDAKKDKADDPNRINYTINAVEAIVDNRSQRTEQNLREMAATQQRLEAELAETRKELSEMKSEMMALLQRVVEKVDA